MGPRINFNFLGLQISLTKYSSVKKLTVITSMTLMICKRSGYSTSPSSLYWSSSMVEMIKVKVEMRTMVREKNAQNLKYCGCKILFIYMALHVPSCFTSPGVFHCVPKPGSPLAKEIITKIFFISKLHLFLLCCNIPIFLILTNLQF